MAQISDNEAIYTVLDQTNSDGQYDLKNAAMFGTVAYGMCKENYSKVKWIEN